LLILTAVCGYGWNSLILSMLLQLENTDSSNLKKLMDYARQLNLRLSLVDENENNVALPGKPLSDTALRSLIESGRKTGVISMESAHNIIRKNLHAD
jgi:hypothetical protein